MDRISCKWLSCLWSNQPIRLIDAMRIIPLRMRSGAVFRTWQFETSSENYTSTLCFLHWTRIKPCIGHVRQFRIAHESERIAAPIRLIQSNFIKWKTTATKITPFIFHITLAIFLCIAAPSPELRAIPETFSLLLRWAFLTFGWMESDTHWHTHSHAFGLGGGGSDAECLHINCTRWL